jgi:hypothetical protein
VATTPSGVITGEPAETPTTDVEAAPLAVGMRRANWLATAVVRVTSRRVSPNARCVEGFRSCQIGALADAAAQEAEISTAAILLADWSEAESMVLYPGSARLKITFGENAVDSPTF